MHAATLPLRIKPRRHSAWRLSTFALVESAAALAGGRRFYKHAFLERGRLVLRQESLPVAGLPAALEGFSIVQLSDFHAGALLGRGSLEHAVELANAQTPRLVVLTGDFITHHWRQALELLEDLGRLRADLGVFAVFGNHDYRGRNEARIAEAFAERGIRFLRNEGVRLEIDGAGVVLCGVEDLEEARCVDIEATRACVRPGDVEIDLCHNPRRAQHLARAGVAAIFCGHTHGAQIDLPWLRRLGPPHPGARVHLGATRVITSRGLGAVGIPLRCRASAEIVIARLRRATSEVGA
jgi:predicted MPP superfamily phosphohydrolase